MPFDCMALLSSVGPLFDQLAGVRDGGSAGYLLLLIDLDYFGRGMLCV